MNIVIIGWYGTETIGDRAILAGIISFLTKSIKSFSIELGSLYPFFSERTICEDIEFYNRISPQPLDVSIFNSQSSRTLTDKIRTCDLVIMGGGPLMDLDNLFMVEYAFKKAKRFNKKTAILGCGVGPLSYAKYERSVLQVIKFSDLTILRDRESKLQLEKISTKHNFSINLESISVSFDPSVECCLNFLRITQPVNHGYISVNLRDFPQEYSSTADRVSVNQNLVHFIRNLSEKYHHTPINLVPMHYFHIGDDDRAFFNTLCQKIDKNNLYVQNEPLSLIMTLHTFYNSWFSIGMRFHSVVFQTIVNGKNFVLDYTKPKTGKISGFLNDINHKGFYSRRYINLQEDAPSLNIINNENLKHVYDKTELENRLHLYVTSINNLLK